MCNNFAYEYPYVFTDIEETNELIKKLINDEKAQKLFMHHFMKSMREKSTMEGGCNDVIASKEVEQEGFNDNDESTRITSKVTQFWISIPYV